MHGLIVLKLQEFYDHSQGDGAFQTLTANLPKKHTEYLIDHDYPDEEVFGIVGAISQSLDIELAQALHLFGHYLADDFYQICQAWALSEPHWTTLDYVENTPSIIHAQVQRLRPESNVPPLVVERHDANHLSLIYRSPRKLCPLAEGVISGFADLFKEKITIKHPRCLLRGDDHCRLELSKE